MSSLFCYPLFDAAFFLVSAFPAVSNEPLNTCNQKSGIKDQTQNMKCIPGTGDAFHRVFKLHQRFSIYFHFQDGIGVGVHQKMDGFPGSQFIQFIYKGTVEAGNVNRHGLQTRKV